MKKTHQIGILGCGWLGFATAKKLIANGYDVKGSVTSEEKIHQLQTAKIKPYVITLTHQPQIANLKSFLSDLDILVIAVPPKIKQDKSLLTAAFETMFKNYDFSPLKKLIYISSTGVFKDDFEAVYHEESLPNNTSIRGQILIGLEKIILEQEQILNKTVLRLGGLIKQGGRHPVHFLSGRQDIANPEGPVNLIDQSDAVNLLCHIIEHKNPLNVYHGVYPYHPSRKEYYTQKALELKLEKPVFETHEKSVGKIILSERTQEHLEFFYQTKV